MKVTEFPPELLREIVKLSINLPSVGASRSNIINVLGDPEAEDLPSQPMMSFDSYRLSTRTTSSTRCSSPSLAGSSSGCVYFADKLEIALVCRKFWEIANEFLYAAVSLSKPSHAINLAHGLTLHVDKYDPAPAYWIHELEIKSYFELDEQTAEALKCILEHCTRLSALRISGSFLDRRHPFEITRILSAVPSGVVHFEFDAISVYSRRDREHAHSENGLYDALERISPTLRILKLPASRYLYLFNGRSNVLDGVTRLELCFSSPDMSMMTRAYDDPSLASWPLESLTHLTLSYIPLNRDSDDTPVRFLLCMPPPSSMLFPISRRVSFPLHDLLEAAPNLQELDYRPFSLHTTSLWRLCASASLRHVVLRADGISYTEMHRNQLFDVLREQIRPLSSKDAFPNLKEITVMTEHPCISLEIIARSLRQLKDSEIDIRSVVVPSANPPDWYDLMVM